LAAAGNVNLLPGIFVISVNDGIVQGLAQSNFNVSLVSGCTSAPLDQEHELVYKWRDCSNLASQGQLGLYARTAMM
jgi:hypothetical protein